MIQAKARGVVRGFAGVYKAFRHYCGSAFFIGLVLLFLAGEITLFKQLVCAQDIMLAGVYTEKTDLCGWLMSEKLDGIRGYWTGTEMLSKSGKRLSVPRYFTANFPSFALEGELWAGRGGFSRTVSIVRKSNQEAWQQLKFAIFDVPEMSGGFTERLQHASKWFAKHPSRFVFVIEQIPVKSREHLYKKLEQIERVGGEGLIVRRSAGLYTAGRSSEILKVKNFLDAEAVVLCHFPGKGRNRNRLGALKVQLLDNKAIQFKIGTGFSDRERNNPPPVGTIITFKYYGRYPSGIPRFPSFLRVREDTNL